MCRRRQPVAMMATQFVLICLAITAVTVVSCSTFNVALYKPASQSSLYNNASTADKAVDGNYDPVFGNSCASTRHFDREPWWRVDLGRMYHVTSVGITNRNHVGDRLHDLTVTVMEETSATPTVCGEYPGAVPDGANITVTCYYLTWGRYVTVSKPSTHEFDILTLCEVEVMVVDRSRMTLQRLVGKQSSQGGSIVSMETTLPDCAHVCKHSDGCMGLNYRPQSSQCQLLTSTVHTDAPVNHSWSLYVIML
ncbi:fucolectin-1-like [Haliotis cracherodii]|uniref:fucolectin-1-like n=1 Tax=Haliotis cracherodii TaxID=6455 RepID=UPI0039EB5BB6